MAGDWLATLPIIYGISMIRGNVGFFFFFLYFMFKFQMEISIFREIATSEQNLPTLSICQNYLYWSLNAKFMIQENALENVIFKMRAILLRPHTFDTWQQCKNLGQFAMPETCENWLDLENSCIYYARQTCEIYQYCLTQWISKLPGALKSTE